MAGTEEVIGNGKNKFIDTLKGMIGGSLSGIAVVYIGISLNEQAIIHEVDRAKSEDVSIRTSVERLKERHDELSKETKVLYAQVREMKESAILPEADRRITTLEQSEEDQIRRLSVLENFQAKGTRCTGERCEKMDKRIEKIEDYKAGMAVALATMEFRLRQLEKMFANGENGNQVNGRSK